MVAGFFSVEADLAQKLPKKDLIFVDGIKAVFRGSEGTDLVFESQLQRPKLDGTRPTLEATITDLALAQEAKKYRVWPTPEEIDKQWRMLAESNKKTLKEFEDLLIAAGFTPQEGRNEFAQINAINSLVGFKITGNLIVTEAAVMQHYNENPEYEPTSYYIEYALIPLDSAITPQEQLKNIEKMVKNHDANHDLPWGAAFWVKEEELAQDKQFITQLVPNQISLPVQTEQGFELFRLKSKKEGRQLTLDERYNEIVGILRKPTYARLMDEFQKDLLDKASIIYFDLP